MFLDNEAIFLDVSDPFKPDRRGKVQLAEIAGMKVYDVVIYDDMYVFVSVGVDGLSLF